MAILAECPICHNKQSIKKKKCRCGTDLDIEKKGKRVRYWIKFRLHDGTQRKEYVSKSIQEARDADGKRRGQKREGRIFDMLPESKVTFNELAEWYLDLKSVKKLASFDRVELSLKQFNKVFGKTKVNNLQPVDLEDYQDKRKAVGREDATVDMEIRVAQTMVTKAFDNDKIDGRSLKAFRRVKKLLKKGSNVRKVLISIEKYVKLLKHASHHYKAVLVIAFNTGMRLGEIRLLQWAHIDKKDMMIRLPREVTKESQDKNIPINHYVSDALDSLPRAIQHDFVITYKGKALNQKNSLKKQFQETCEKAGIPYGRKIKGGITFHDTRRTVKTNMVAAGVDKVYRDTILGHSLKGMDIHYIIPTDEALMGAMEKYTSWLDGRLEVVFQNGPHIGPQVGGCKHGRK